MFVPFDLGRKCGDRLARHPVVIAAVVCRHRVSTHKRFCQPQSMWLAETDQ